MECNSACSSKFTLDNLAPGFYDAIFFAISPLMIKTSELSSVTITDANNNTRATPITPSMGMFMFPLENDKLPISFDVPFHKHQIGDSNVSGIVCLQSSSSHDLLCQKVLSKSSQSSRNALLSKADNPAHSREHYNLVKRLHARVPNHSVTSSFTQIFETVGKHGIFTPYRSNPEFFLLSPLPSG